MKKIAMSALFAMCSCIYGRAQECTKCTANLWSYQATGSCSIGTVSFQASNNASCSAACIPSSNCTFSFTVSVTPTPVPCAPNPVMKYDFWGCPGVGPCITAPTTYITLPFLQIVDSHPVQCGWKEYAWITESFVGTDTIVAWVQLECSSCGL